MNTNDQSSLQEKRFRLIGTYWLGNLEDYFFKISEDAPSSKKINLELSLKMPEAKAGLLESLDSFQKDQLIENYELKDSRLTLAFIQGNLKMNLGEFLAALTQKFKSLGLQNRCENCENNLLLNNYQFKQDIKLFCPSCAQKIEQEIAEKNQKPQNYALGFLASLVGALLGSILWIVLGVLGFYASIAGFAIAYCSLKAYEMAGSKKSKFGILLNLLAILLALAFAQYAVLFVQFIKELPGLGLKEFLEASPLLFSDPEFIQALLPNLALGLLFAVLGTFRTIKENFTQAAEAEGMKFERIFL